MLVIVMVRTRSCGQANPTQNEVPSTGTPVQEVRPRDPMPPPRREVPSAGTSAQGSRSIDPARFEELESDVAALRAILSDNRLQEIEASQQEVMHMMNELSHETKNAISEIRLEMEEHKAQINLVQVAVGNSLSIDRG